MELRTTLELELDVEYTIRGKYIPATHTDPACRIQVNEISVSRYFSKFPTCIYTGPVLRKDNTPRKDGRRDSVRQSNVQEVELSERYASSFSKTLVVMKKESSKAAAIQQVATILRGLKDDIDVMIREVEDL